MTSIERMVDALSRFVPVRPQSLTKLARVPCPVGDRFGRLTVMSEGLPYSTRRIRRWTCRCECGVTRDISMANIRARIGSDQSCGCNRGERGRFTSERNPNARFSK